MAHTLTVAPSTPARIRAMVVPREHGAWGLLLVPLFTGIAAGAASAHQALSLVLFTVAALALFWLRTPVESLIGAGAMRAQTSVERRVALLASLALAALSTACLATLLWNGSNPELLYPGGAAALALIAQMLLKRVSRKTRMAAQIAGAIGLTCTAPAAYYVATGRLDARAFALWAANWIFAANQIHFVQLRIHAARAASFGEKFAKGKVFFFSQLLTVCVLIAAFALHLAPSLIVFAFLPVLFRGTYWFFSGFQPLQVHKLGWSEMRQGIAFGILLATAFIAS